MRYLEWNDIIARRFFNEEKSGREVLLYVNKAILDEIGSRYAANTNDFIDAIKQGPPWVASGEICQIALQTYRGWRKRDLEYPPYIAYLSFFVLAAGTEGPFAPHAYYPRFWKLLHEPKHSEVPRYFDRMIDLWDDLEKWSSEDKREQLGRFKRRIRGKWERVGLPLSQTLLSDEERKRLPNLFYQADLDPADSPSPEVVPGILQYFGQGILERRTLRLLEGRDDILKKALALLVLDQLDEWDGAITRKAPESGESKSHTQAFLRICIHIDSVSRTVKGYLRLKMGSAYPNEELNLEEKQSSCRWFCKEISQGWSTKLKKADVSPPEVLNPTGIYWDKGIILQDKENELVAKLKGATTRLFVQGRHEGLPDWIESRRLERSAEFFVVCTGRDIEKVEQWGSRSCKEFEKRDYSGLPPGWKIYYGKNASEPCEGIDVLAVSGTTRLLLKGGIKTGTGNSYLVFAPPRIVLENSAGDEVVTANGARIKKIPEVPVWVLPGDYSSNEILRIEAKGKETELLSIIRLEDPRLSLSFNDVPSRDSKGMLRDKDDKSSSVSGVLVNKLDEDLNEPFPRDLPIHLSHRVIFIGKIPGEISDWPRQPLPSKWRPVWAIGKLSRKKWRVYFCGKEEDFYPAELPSGHIADYRDMKRWKEILWTKRKTIRVAGFKPVYQAWIRYREAARCLTR
jgi:hypothetical protein